METSMQHASKSVPQIDAACISALVAAGVDVSVLTALLTSISSIARLIDRLPERMNVPFPATRSPPPDLDRPFLMIHWKEVAGRALVARFCADRSLRDLLCGFVSAINEGNVVVCALCARAALESAASYDALARSFVGRKEKIEAGVLPFIRGEAGLVSSFYDRALIDELIRFQHGARLWPTGDCPQTVAEWKAWREHSRYESKEDAEKRGDDQSIAGQLLDALNANQRNILTCIEKVSRREQNMAALGLYDMLSEYCHPNADNRSIGIESSELREGEALVGCVGAKCWTPGANKGAWLGALAIIEAIDIHADAHNAIQDSSHELFVELALRHRTERC